MAGPKRVRWIGCRSALAQPAARACLAGHRQLQALQSDIDLHYKQARTAFCAAVSLSVYDNLDVCNLISVVMAL